MSNKLTAFNKTFFDFPRYKLIAEVLDFPSSFFTNIATAPFFLKEV